MLNSIIFKQHLGQAGWHLRLVVCAACPACILDGGWSLFGLLRVSICVVATVALVVAYAGAALAQSTADIAAANGTAAQPPNKTNQLAAIAEVERAASWMA